VHEASIASAILQKACTMMRSQHGGVHSKSIDTEFDITCHITKIVIRIGEFRNVDPESLEFAFDALKKDSEEVKDAKLEMQSVSARAVCTNQHEFHPSAANYFACNNCGEKIESFLAGEELDIISIESEIPVATVGGQGAR
jgi:hydrogenase nickel incorporation protein HypA/HybF